MAMPSTTSGVRYGAGAVVPGGMTARGSGSMTGLAAFLALFSSLKPPKLVSSPLAAPEKLHVQGF